MLHSIGSMKNLPADFNLNSIPDYFKEHIFTTSVGFRCYHPTLVNNYPVEENGILYINKMNNLLKVYYFTKNATYISTGLYIGNTVRKIDWFQVMDGRHSSIYNNDSTKKFVTDNDVKTIVETYLTRYNDSELWSTIEPKFHKDHWNGYANKNNPHIRRGNTVSINTNNGLVVAGSNVVISRDRGLAVQSPSGSSIRATVSGAIDVLGVRQASVSYIVSDRKLVIQSRNRPIAQNNDAGGGNREIVIRGDLRWKQMYNGRQGLRSIAYPAHAREVIVQLYTDVGGRIHRSQYNFPHFKWGATPFNDERGRRWRDINPVEFRIGGEPVNGIIGRDRGYREYAPMHFIRGLYNRINQDTAFVEHHGHCVITVNSIGYDNIVNGRSYSAQTHNFNPLDQNMALIDERYGFGTNRTRILTLEENRVHGFYQPPSRYVRDLALSTYPYSTNQWPMYIVSESAWRSNNNLGHPVNDIPYIRRVWWR